MDLESRQEATIKKVYLFTREGDLLWSRKTGGYINSVALSSDGLYLAVGSEDGKVYLLNREGRLLWSFDSGDAVRSVAISRNGSYVATGSANNYVYLLDSEGKTVWGKKDRKPDQQREHESECLLCRCRWVKLQCLSF
ncbi:WD40 repeat domain-containing protein [Methanosarcina horonobensis]|uniref:WD40 repeat domain-containing protein n=1 Tax=Methanosarcina horonobensis TaxID=418008 RepID=UPI0022B92148|nr:PQQ-binding-like beta-propeller repeat protein [Methanosarcina horonobensis]